MLELLLAFGVFVFLMAASTALQLKALRASEDAGRRARASMLARDYLSRAAVGSENAGTASTAPVGAAATAASSKAGCRSGRPCTPARFAEFLVEDWMGAHTAANGGAYSAVKNLPGGRFCEAAGGPGEAITLVWPALSAAVLAKQNKHCPMPGPAPFQSLTLWGYGGSSR